MSDTWDEGEFDAFLNTVVGAHDAVASNGHTKAVAVLDPAAHVITASPEVAAHAAALEAPQAPEEDDDVAAVKPRTRRGVTPQVTPVAVVEEAPAAQLGSWWVKAPAKALQAALKQTKPAISARMAQPLLKGVRITAAARMAQPLLKGVRISVAGQLVELTATDLDVTIRTYVADATVGSQESADGVVVDHRLFTQTMASIKTGDVQLTVDGLDLVVTTPNLRTTIMGYSTDDWPLGPTVIAAHRNVTLDPQAFAEVAAAASTDEARPILTAVCVKGSSYVATDSYRLNMVDSPWESGFDKPVLIPARLAKLFGGATGVVVGTADPSNMRVGTPYGSVTIRLIEGEFIRYEQLIPAEADVKPLLTFTRPAIDAAAKAATPFSDAGNRPVRFGKSGAQPGVLHVWTEDRDGGVAFEMTVPGDSHIAPATGRDGNYSAAPGSVGFNGRYFTDMLAGTTAEVIKAVDGNPLKPAILRETTDRGVRTRLLMPVRI